MKTSYIIVLGAFALFLSGCGGGSSSTNATATAAPSAAAHPHASASPCNVQCQDDEAFQIEKPNLETGTPEANAVAYLAKKIAPAAQQLDAKDGHPQFLYYTTNQKDPNAYEYYGPRVYISHGMADYVDTQEELAGIMCHESSHVIDHDGLRSAKVSAIYSAKEKAIVAKAERLLHGHFTSRVQRVADWTNNFEQLRYTRQQEYAADALGAKVCSEAGINPWGLVAILKKMNKDPNFHTGRFTFGSDHPSNQARISALKRELGTPDFLQFKQDMAQTPLHLKK